jgi:ubiquinone/menaquinone biosynthesis C-methylase UbiE
MHFIRSRSKGEPPAPRTRGAVIRWPRTYDLILWVFTRGREQELRQTIADLAQLQRGETVLDVGCGSGTLALVAKKGVGRAGRVVGIDPSREMIARARRKARKAGLSIDFQLGVIEQLTFPDQSFDVMLCTWMIHHVPDDLKRQGLLEIARVLKPGGRLLPVDSNLNSLALQEAGFSQTESGQLPFPRGVDFVKARKDLVGENSSREHDDLTLGKEISRAQATPQERPFPPSHHFHTL